MPPRRREPPEVRHRPVRAPSVQAQESSLTRTASTPHRATPSHSSRNRPQLTPNLATYHTAKMVKLEEVMDEEFVREQEGPHDEDEWDTDSGTSSSSRYALPHRTSSSRFSIH